MTIRVSPQELLVQTEKRLDEHFPGEYTEEEPIDVNTVRIAYYQGKKAGIRHALLVLQKDR